MGRDIMFCIKCGTALESGESRCRECGFVLPHLTEEQLEELMPVINDPTDDNAFTLIEAKEVEQYSVGCEPIAGERNKTELLQSTPLSGRGDPRPKKSLLNFRKKNG